MQAVSGSAARDERSGSGGRTRPRTSGGSSGDATTDPPVGSPERGRDADKPTEIPAEGWKDIGRRIKDEFGDDNTTLLAAGIAYYVFTALVPGLLAVVSVYGILRTPAEAAARIQELTSGLPESASQLLEDQISNVASQSSAALSFAALVSIALALWSASGAMSQVANAVGAIYDEPDDRGFVAKRLSALLLTVVAVVGMVALVTALTFAARVGGALGVLATVAAYAVAAALVVGFLTLLYRIGPERDDATLSWITPGAVIATVLALLATIALQIYVSNFGSYNETYGSLAAVVILLLWLWIVAVVVLLGAHINAEMEHQTARDTTVDGDEPMGRRDARVADTVGDGPDVDSDSDVVGR